MAFSSLIFVSLLFIVFVVVWAVRAVLIFELPFQLFIFEFVLIFSSQFRFLYVISSIGINIMNGKTC